jgi:hypothetical protein
MNYARINTQSELHTVIETFVPPSGFTINDCFTPEIVAQFEQVPDEVAQGWIKQEDGTFIAPPPLPEPPVPEEPITVEATEVPDNTLPSN